MATAFALTNAQAALFAASQQVGNTINRANVPWDTITDNTQEVASRYLRWLNENQPSQTIRGYL